MKEIQTKSHIKKYAKLHVISFQGKGSNSGPSKWLTINNCEIHTIYEMKENQFHRSVQVSDSRGKFFNAYLQKDSVYEIEGNVLSDSLTKHVLISFI